METTSLSLPGIKQIAWIDRSALPQGLEVYAATADPVPILTELNKVCFFGNPELIRNFETDRAKRVETVTLTFRTCEILPPTSQMALIVTSNNNKSYVIGLDKPPFPSVTFERKTSGPDITNDIEYKVTATGLYALVECLVSC